MKNREITQAFFSQRIDLGACFRVIGLSDARRRDNFSLVDGLRLGAVPRGILAHASRGLANIDAAARKLSTNKGTLTQNSVLPDHRAFAQQNTAADPNMVVDDNWKAVIDPHT
jgi:hypothetical protein